MSRLPKLLSFLGLVLTIVPSLLVFAQAIAWNPYLTMMTVGTLLWFSTAPFWMKRES
jgi:uncharacterized membrane protein